MFDDIINEPKIIIHELCMGDIHKCKQFTSKFDSKNLSWDYEECHYRKLSGGAINICMKKSPHV